jgi:hypothetical protein
MSDKKNVPRSPKHHPVAVKEGPPRSARVFEDLLHPGDWRVEWFDDKGDVELAFFAGTKAHERAIRYADREYGALLKMPYPYAR